VLGGWGSKERKGQEGKNKEKTRKGGRKKNVHEERKEKARSVDEGKESDERTER